MTGIFALLGSVFFGGIYLYNKSNKEKMRAAESAVDTANLPPLVRDWSPSIGTPLARVEVVEYLDPECESCRVMHPIVKNILKEFEGKIRYVVRYMPYHHNSMSAAKILQSVKGQDLYWKLLDVLFEKQDEWSAGHGAPEGDSQAKLVDVAVSAGLSIEDVRQALANEAFAKQVNQDKEDGDRLGVRGTPSFFVNGRLLEELGEKPLRAAIQAAAGP